MKNYLTEWKKYLLREDVKTATDAASQATKNRNAI